MFMLFHLCILTHNNMLFAYITGERGYDTHGTQAETFDEKLPLLNQALQAFVNEIKDQGNWDDITIVIGSDFGRTLNSNSGEGKYLNGSHHSNQGIFCFSFAISIS